MNFRTENPEWQWLVKALASDYELRYMLQLISVTEDLVTACDG